MRFTTLGALRQIYKRWPSETPKIIERLLAISFDPKRGGFAVESRSTEGVDICLIGFGSKYAVEVKTTTGTSVILQEKDISGLREKRIKDGYHPCVAALRIDLLEEWVVANGTKLETGAYTPVRLSLDSLPTLEAIARTHFEPTVTEFVELILSPPGGSPLGLLAKVLEGESG